MQLTVILVIINIHLFTSIIAVKSVRFIHQFPEKDDLCDAGWTSFQDEKCFKLFTDRKTQNDAQIHCLSYNASLASIRSEDERLFLRSYVLRETPENKVSQTWVGGQHRFGIFYWFDLSSSYFPWVPGLPIDDENYDSIGFTTTGLNKGDTFGRLFNAFSNSEFNFVCEKKILDKKLIEEDSQNQNNKIMEKLFEVIERSTNGNALIHQSLVQITKQLEDLMKSNDQKLTKIGFSTETGFSSLWSEFQLLKKSLEYNINA